MGLVKINDQARAYFGLFGQTRLRLDSLMTERGLTDMTLSRAAGVHPTTVKLIANDLPATYDFSVLARLCAFFQLPSLEELLDSGGVLAWKPGETSRTE
jgi:DNA-binding Xre family transcriptional regulator